MHETNAKDKTYLRHSISLNEDSMAKLDAMRETKLFTYNAYGRLVSEIISRVYQQMIESGYITRDGQPMRAIRQLPPTDADA